MIGRQNQLECMFDMKKKKFWKLSRTAELNNTTS